MAVQANDQIEELLDYVANKICTTEERIDMQIEEVPLDIQSFQRRQGRLEAYREILNKINEWR